MRPSFINRTARDIENILLHGIDEYDKGNMKILDSVMLLLNVDPIERDVLIETLKGHGIASRRMLAKNHQTHPEILHHLAEDSTGSSEIRCLVAENESTWAKTLEMLSSDPVDSVRNAVAKNKNTPKEVILKLAKDKKSKIKKAALITLDENYK